jgi:hypothetical protein
MLNVHLRCDGIYGEVKRAEQQCIEKSLALAAEHIDWAEPLEMNWVPPSSWLRRKNR